VLDESQKIKNPSAKRTKFLISIKDRFSHRRILTGTPATNGVENLFTQLKFLHTNIIGISSFYAFRNRYCILGGWENKQIVGYRLIEEIQDKMKPYTARVMKYECLDLPDKIYKKSFFDMTPKQREMYKSVKNEGLALISQSKEIILEQAISKLTKMQQIADGFIIDTETREIIDLVEPDKNPKLLQLKEDLENISGKVIIWTTFQHNVSNIMKILGKEAVRYAGGMSPEESKEAIQKFKTDDNIKYFVSNLQKGATGLTLTEAEYSYYYNNSYDLELRLQSEDRNHRIGTINSVIYTDLIANNSIDNKIVTALQKKKSIQEMILEDGHQIFEDS
jgi:SNF2 family DNA or RNA helicase